VLPGDLIGVVILLAAVAPGYVYVRVAEHYRSRPERSALLETAEVVVIGAGCTTLAAGALVGIGQWVDGIVLDTSSWIRHGNAYLRSRPDLLLRSAALALVLAFLVAYVAARVVNRGRPRHIVPGIAVRSGVFEAARREGKRGWVAVHLKNGTIVEGYLQAYPTGDVEAPEIALQKPTGLTEPDSERSIVSGVDSVVIGGDEIALITVRVEDD
jgi:Family of unknown function (DUF6338)